MSLQLNGNGYVRWEQEEDGSLLKEQYHRREDEVERLGNLDCRLLTSFKTPYTGVDTGRGTMFTIKASESIEMLTMEFEAFQQASDLSVQVYYRQGEFSGATNDPDQWTQLADTVAQRAPDARGAIIPTNDFIPTQLFAGEIYSLYLHFQTSSVCKLKGSSELIGSEADFDDVLQIQVGVTLDDGPFPERFSGASEFSGMIHYRTVKSCEDVRITTDVELQFAVNDDPEAEIIQELSDAVEGAMSALLILIPNLIRFEKFHMLEVVNVQSGFQGRSKEKCPEDYDKCSLIYSTLTFSHLQTIGAGELRQKVLSEDEKIGESVTAQADFEVRYVGDPVTSVDFIITLEGVPPGSTMNALQRRYFEKITTDVLSQFSEMPIYRAEVVEVIAVFSNSEERLLVAGLRGSRQLQTSGKTHVSTTIYGTGTEQDLRTNVLESVGGNVDRYLKELSLQQLRPGEINTQNSGDLFKFLTGAVIMIKPADFGASGDNDKPAITAADGDQKTSPYIPIFIVCMVISLLWLVYRVYKDYFYAPKEKQQKLQRFGTKGEKGQEHDNTSESDSPDQKPRTGVLPPGDPMDESDHPVPARRRSNPNLAGRTNPNRPGLNDPSRSPPRNTAGENGRGIKPSRSMPMLRRPPPPNSKPDDGDEASVRTNRSNTSGGPRKEPQRGVRPNRSMPYIKRPPQKHSPSSDNENAESLASKAGDPERKAPQRGLQPSRSMPYLKRPPQKQSPSSDDEKLKSLASTAGGPTKKELQRGVQPSRSMPFLRRTPNKESSSSNEETEPSGQKTAPTKKSPISQQKKVPNKQSQGGEDESIESSEEGEVLPSKHRAGNKRGVQSTKSLPVGSKFTPMKKDNDYDEALWSSDESSDDESSDERDNESNRVPLFPSKNNKPARSLSDDESRSVTSKKSQMSHKSAVSKRPAEPKKRPGTLNRPELKKNPPKKPTRRLSNDECRSVTSKESQRSNKSGGSNGPAPKNRPELKNPPKKPTRRLSNDESPSVTSKESQRSNKSGVSKGPAPKNRAGMSGRGIGASKSMPTVIKKQVPSKDNFSDSESSEESDLESDIEYEVGRVPKNKAFTGPVAKKKKTPPKKHAPMSHSDDESRSTIDTNSVRSRKSLTSNKSGHLIEKHTPKNQADLNGRGIGASKSMPTGINKKVPVNHLSDSESSEESDYEETAIKRGTSDGKKSNPLKPVVKKQPTKHPPKKPARCQSDDESRSVTSKKSHLSNETGISQGSAPKNRAGMNGRGIGASKSMPTLIKKKAPPKELDSDSESSEESDLESDIESEVGRVPLNKASTGPVAKKNRSPPKKLPPKKHCDAMSKKSVQSSKSLMNNKSGKKAPSNEKLYDSDSSEESNYEEQTATTGDKPERKNLGAFGKPAVKRNTAKHPPKKPARRLSNDESPSVKSKQSLSSKKSGVSTGSAPKNRAGEKGRGIGASKSMPTIAKKKISLQDLVYESDSSEESGVESKSKGGIAAASKSSVAKKGLHFKGFPKKVTTCSDDASVVSAMSNSVGPSMHSRSQPERRPPTRPTLQRIASQEFGKAGKIKFAPLHGASEDASVATKTTSKSSASAVKTSKSNSAGKKKLTPAKGLSEDEKKDD